MFCGIRFDSCGRVYDHDRPVEVVIDGFRYPCFKSRYYADRYGDSSVVVKVFSEDCYGDVFVSMDYPAYKKYRYGAA